MDPKEKLKELIKYPEDEILEFKRAEKTFEFDKLGKYFSALSNEANLRNKKSAWMLFGIGDNKAILGTNYLKGIHRVNEIKQDVSVQTTNNISFCEIYETIEDGKRILLFEIPAAIRGAPTGWKGHFYARNGESLGPLSLEKIERIRSQETKNDWSSQICVKATVKDLDLEAIQKAKKGFGQKNPNISKEEIENWSNEVFLNKAKITIKGKITNTAILLLGKAEAEHFLSPAVAKISWILKGQNNIEKDYRHFSCPFILSIDKVFHKIRNLRYRYMFDSANSLFPEEIDSYDPITIREAINNCIAHQDYLLGGKINVIENENDNLIFTNLGSFIPGTIENVIESDAPPEYYRNRFLVDAMVNLNMIDTIGSGIRKMFISQKTKFFPLPEYDFSNNRVKLTIIGKVIDMQYAEKIIQIPDLDLKTIIALDKVQKQKRLTKHEVKELRKKDLIEGRHPNMFISRVVAKKLDRQGDYMKMKGIEDKYIKEMIINYLTEFKGGRKSDFHKMLFNKLSDLLDEQQKANKIKNILQGLKKQGKIKLCDDKRTWKLIKDI